MADNFLLKIEGIFESKAKVSSFQSIVHLWFS